MIEYGVDVAKIDMKRASCPIHVKNNIGEDYEKTNILNCSHEPITSDWFLVLEDDARIN